MADPEADPERSSSPSAEPPLAPRPRLRVVAGLFARIGAMSFGGGMAGWYFREVVERRRWMAELDFLSGLALAQILPGINATNLLVYIGQRLHGWVGAAVVPASLLFFPVLITIGLGAGYSEVAHHPWVHRFLEGAAAAAVGLTATLGFRAFRHSTKDPGLFVTLAATFVCIGILRWPMVAVAPCTAVFGIASAWRIRGRVRSEKNDA
jgi:chromate transporter